MSREPATLIFDIGKTTKKVLLFNKDFLVLEEQNSHIHEIHDEDGFPSEDLQTLSEWVKDFFKRYVHHPSYEITDINFSTYGASLVHLKDDEKPAGSFYNYLKSVPEDLTSEFLLRYPEISLQTASPFLGMLNSGLQLLWLKRYKPHLFSEVKHTLHFPQYFPFLLTGEMFNEKTSLGCHTMMWDFIHNTYHSWLYDEQLTHLFPPVHPSNHTTVFKFKDRVIRCGIGVHDSSAALMPYLSNLDNPFILLSTGTWNIAFNPFNHSPLTEQELKKDCLCYMTPEGKPVKASRIFLGREYEVQQEEMTKFFGKKPAYHASIKFDEALYNQLNSGPPSLRPFFPVCFEGTGPLPEKNSQKTDLINFENFEEAYHQLLRYLVQWQKLSLDLIDPIGVIKDIILVGGFTKNSAFLQTLKRELPDKNILTSENPRASALGSALLAGQGNNNRHHKKLLKLSRL